MASTNERPVGSSKYGGQEYSTPLNLFFRWDYYRLSDNFVDPYNIAYDFLEPHIEPTDTIADLGCFIGDGLELFRQRSHHGRLIGIDIEEAFQPTLYTTKSTRSFEYKRGDINDIPLPNNSVQASTAMFSLYHAADMVGGDPKVGLAEIQRITEPGGPIVLATSGKANKIHHRVFERRLAEFLSHMLREEIGPAPTFNSSFDTDIADEVLPQFLDDVEEVSIEDFASIRRYDGSLGKYVLSIGSMISSFAPHTRIPPAIIALAAKEVIKDPVDDFIEEHGVFLDTIDRKVYRGFNRKVA